MDECTPSEGSRLLATVWIVMLGAIATATTTAAAVPQPTTIAVEVDLRDLPRRLVHSTIEIPCKPGRELALWHPKWIPGTHEPCGSIETVGGLRIQTPDGAAIPWRRDELELYRIVFKAPPDVKSVRVTLDTICNHAAIEASGNLTFGNKLVGVVNWSTCVLYPEGPTADETRVELSTRLPEKWKYATALKTESNTDGLIKFAPVSLVDLVDSPMIAGEHLRTIKLETGPHPPASFHLASDAPSSLELHPQGDRAIQQDGPRGRGAVRLVSPRRFPVPRDVQRRPGLSRARTPGVEHQRRRRPRSDRRPQAA